MFGRVVTMLIKEFIELRRDVWARFRLTVPPIIQVIIFGYAATFEVFGVSTVILDRDHSYESRDFVSRFTYSGRFSVVEIARTDADVVDALDRAYATLAIVIPPGFAEGLRKGQLSPVQVDVDGTNSNTALIAAGYVSEIATTFAQEYALDHAERLEGGKGAMSPQVVLAPRPWYNPNLDSRWFFVPGVIATLTLVMIVNLTSFAIVREREVGTLEQIMVTPIRPMEFILGKTAPFFLVGMGLVSVIAGVGTLWFQIPFVGNPFVLLLGTSLYLHQHARPRAPDFDPVLDAAAGLRDQLLHRQSALHALGFRHPDRDHARRDAKVHLSQSHALLSHHHPRNFSQGGRIGGAVA